MKYTVVISDEGYSISCPALPGCWSQGKTEEEAVANIGEAIQDYLIEAPRRRARTEHSTLNKQFRLWLEDTYGIPNRYAYKSSSNP